MVSCQTLITINRFLYAGFQRTQANITESSRKGVNKSIAIKLESYRSHSTLISLASTTITRGCRLCKIKTQMRRNKSSSPEVCKVITAGTTALKQRILKVMGKCRGSLRRPMPIQLLRQKMTSLAEKEVRILWVSWSKSIEPRVISAQQHQVLTRIRKATWPNWNYRLQLKS